MNERGLGAALTLFALLAGCKGAEDDLAPAVVPKAVNFEGQIDPSYLGTWRSTDGSSVLALDKSGTIAIDSTTVSVKGKSTDRLNGRWLASGGNLLFRYAEKSGGETILKYAATLAGDTLVLQQPGGRLKTTYKRK